MADSLRFRLDLDATSVAEASKSLNAFHSASAAVSSLLQGDFVSAVQQGGGAIRAVIQAIKAMPVAGVVGAIAAIVTAAVKVYEAHTERLLKRAQDLASAWVKARNQMRNILFQPVEDKASEIMEAGDLKVLNEMADKYGKRLEDAANSYLAAKQALMDAASSGASDEEINRLSAAMQSAAGDAAEAKKSFDAFFDAKKSLEKKQEDEAKSRREKAEQDISEYSVRNEEMTAESRGDVALEALYRRRARQSRLDSVQFARSNRTPEAQAEKLRLENEALENEQKANALRRQRADSWKNQVQQSRDQRAASNDAKSQYLFGRMSPEQQVSDLEKRMAALRKSGTDSDRLKFYELAGQRDQVNQSIADRKKDQSEKSLDAQKSLSEMRASAIQSTDVSTLFDRMYAGGNAAWNRQDQSMLDYAKRQAELLKVIADNSQGVR